MDVANFGTASAAELSGGGLALYPGTSTVAPTNRISDSTITGNTLAAKVSGASGSTVYGGGVYDDGVALIFRAVPKSGDTSSSVASLAGGAGRDREVTKTSASDQAITGIKPTI